MNVPDAYQNPYFKREIDEATGYRTRSLLCMPIFDRRGRPFAVGQLINKRSGDAFDAADEAAFREFAASIGVVLESWLQMSRGRRTGAG
jgi:adenylate cyclase